MKIPVIFGNTKQAGMILFQVLFITMLLSLLVQRELQALQGLSNATHRFMVQETRLLHLEQAGQRLALSTYKAQCLVDTLDPNEVLPKLLSKQGCTLQFKKHHYLYLAQDLGPFDATKHWQLSLADLDDPPIVLQLRIARASSMKQSIQSWRLLSNVP